MTREDNETWPECNKRTTSKDIALQCEICITQKVRESQKTFIGHLIMEIEESSQLFSCYCKHCKSGARVMMSHIQRLNAR